MATITNFGNGHSHGLKERKPLPPDPSCQPCPDCGGLECLCRPRFFAGQLLSEQDLNRLDHYITEKHKLHNRHLFGSGVVCGLEVKCAPCDSGLVTVTAGYALSPCGEDIVVCKPDTVDICALIARCRLDDEPDCAPYRGQDSCGEVIEDWILSVRYAESPSRGITPLTGAGQGCGCSCAGPCSGKCGGGGGGGGGSCGCGGGASCSCGAAKGRAEPEALRQPRLNRGAPPSCEPVLTCETYRYDVFRAPSADRDHEREPGGIAGITAQLQGEMMENITCCLKQLQAVLPTPPGDLTQPVPGNQRQAWFQWGCQMRTALANYLVKVGGHDCEAIAALQAIVIPSPGQPAAAFQQAMQIVQTQFSLLVIEAMVACFCSNALPRCPAPGDPRVPLALVRVRRGDCHVISVCNWTPLRKHVLTFPTLEYWFGFIPLIPLLRKVMHKVCCDLFGMRSLFQPKYDRAGDTDTTDDLGIRAAPVDRSVHMMRASREGPAGSTPVSEASYSFKSAVSIDPFADLAISPDLLKAVAMRQRAGGTTATIGDIARAVLERPNMAIDTTLNAEDRQSAIERLAASAPVGVLAGMFASAAPATDFVRALADAPRLDPEVAELKTIVAKQAEDLRALKAQVARGVKPRAAAAAAAETSVREANASAPAKTKARAAKTASVAKASPAKTARAAKTSARAVKAAAAATKTARPAKTTGKPAKTKARSAKTTASRPRGRNK